MTKPKNEALDVFVLLLRGINVGGFNKLPMAALREIITESGAQDVGTYIQSGNAVLRLSAANTKTFLKRLGDRLEGAHGISPRLYMIDRTAYLKTIDQNPFKDEECEPKTIHTVFLEKPASAAALKKIEAATTGEERVQKKGDAVYLFAPQGIARSKAAEKLSAEFPGGTVRNWRTCLKLADMAAAL